MNKSDAPLVSIVLITYNSSKYVLETLESVKNQIWGNIELIISDDGSTDDTTTICSNWLEENKERFHNVQLITVAENTGIPANCNRGLRAVNGQWIKTISGDDILFNNCISDNLQYARRFPEASFIVSDIKEIDENGMTIRDEVINEGMIFIAGMPSTKKQLKAYTRWPVFLNAPTFFCRTEIIEKIGYCDEDFRIYEDTTMVIRMMEEGVRMYYMQQPTVAYRVHRNSISRNARVNDHREREAFGIFKKYRMRHLNIFNPLDLSVYFESWLRFKYKGFNGFRGDSILRKLSLFYWYMKFNGVKSY